MRDALAARGVPRTQLVLVVAMLGLAVAPHLANLSPWITAVFYLMALWRLAAAVRPGLLPGRWPLFALTLATLANVVLHLGVADGRSGGVALLVAMLGLKLLELRNRRDLYMAVFLGYFVIVTQFLFRQDLPLAAFLVAVLVGLTAVLNAMNRARPEAPLRTALGEAARLLGAALPAMVVLFVLFPRLGGPLWSLQVDATGAVSGISNQMSPGSVSQLSLSRATAFRVTFLDETPPPEQRYWRGLVLWDTDGRNWSSGPPLPYSYRRTRPEPSGAPVRYELTLEPTQQPYLFLLDLPLEAPADAHFAPELTAQARQAVTRRTTFAATAWPAARRTTLTPQARERGLWLPDTVTARMQALVDGWRAAGKDDAGMVAAALDYFHTEPFVYTLGPPLLGARPEDEFLFETRRGFCEHYAASFTLLMRLAGIPARVVVGYQGGEYNPHGNYWIVRQSDAHAWAEVWLGQAGWTRVDPTAAVAPERIEHGIATTDAGEGSPVVFAVSGTGLLGGMLREARWLADSLELGWHRWVVGFSRDRQLGLLSELGLGRMSGYGQGLLAVALGAIALMLGAVLLRFAAGSRAADPVLQSYRRLQRKLVRAGLTVPPWQGPRDLQRAAEAAFPAQGRQLRSLFDLYIGLRYGSGAGRNGLHRLRRGVAALRLPRSGGAPAAGE